MEIIWPLLTTVQRTIRWFAGNTRTEAYSLRQAGYQAMEAVHDVVF